MPAPLCRNLPAASSRSRAFLVGRRDRLCYGPRRMCERTFATWPHRSALFTLAAALVACALPPPPDVDWDADPSATDAGGPDSMSDDSAPDTVISMAPDDPTREPVATFQFSANEPATFLCSADGEPFAECSSTYSRAFAEGSHTLRVAAVDLSGNRDPEPAEHPWRVDTTAPETTITVAPALVDNSVNVAFEFEANEIVTFECGLDGGPYQTCLSPQQYLALADGAHSFRVRATDLAGNIDSSPPVHAWTLDSSTPDTTIEGGPTGSVGSTAATFEFTSPNAGPGASFECAVDSASMSACTSPRTYTALAEGSHTFRVRVRSAAGVFDPTPATRTWEIDLTTPETTLDSGPSGTIASASAVLVFSSPDAGATFECALDDADYATCESPLTLTNLTEGPHQVAVRAIDPAGNADPSPAYATWHVDLTTPETQIGSGPPAASNSSSATFQFWAQDTTSATFDCGLDGAAPTPCTTPKTYSGLGEGSHTFSVRARDAAGNLDPTPAVRMWTVDLSPPDVAITGGPDDTNATSATITFSSTDSTATFECALNVFDGSGYESCVSPRTLTGLGDRQHTFFVRARDQAGNVSLPWTHVWTVDTIVPDTQLDSGPATVTNQTSVTFTFSSPGDPSAQFECALDGGAFGWCVSPRTYSPVSSGAHTFTVRARDLVNIDPTPATRSWTVDTLPPNTTIPSRPPAISNSTTASFGFVASETGSTFECSLDGAAFSACATPWTVSGLAQGSHVLLARAVDPAGNRDSTPAEWAWTVDSVAPSLSIGSPSSGITTGPYVTFTFSTNETATTHCSVDTGPYTPCASGVSMSLSQGTHAFRVRATDAAGNESTQTVSWSVLCTAPAQDSSTVVFMHLEDADTSQTLHNSAIPAAPGTKGWTTDADPSDPAPQPSGRYGKALTFTTVAQPPSQQVEWQRAETSVSEFTLEAWVRPTEAPGGWVARQDHVPNHASYGIYHHASGMFAHIYDHVSDTGWSTAVIPVALDSWHHVAVTWSSGTLTLWVDGQSTSVATLANLTPVLSHLRFASQGSVQFVEGYVGDMDELFASSRALTATEIRGRYCPAP
jgi:hypothetical protein